MSLHALTLLAALSTPAAAPPAQDVARAADVPTATGDAPVSNDPLFGHGASASVATGVPFLGMGEAAWGFGDRVTVGALLGATPNVLGVGIRPRVSVLESRTDRLQLVAPILYYPQTADGSPWMLTRPMLEWSHATESGVRFGFGAGLIAAASVGSDSVRPYAGATGNAHGISWWNAVSAHVDVPVSHTTALFAEATAVLRGVRFAGDDWVGGPPVIVSIGASHHFL